MKWLVRFGKWVKSHLILTIVISVIVISSLIVVPIIFNKTLENPKTVIELNDNLSFEVNSEVYLISLVKKISNGELITENFKLDTSKLGTQEVIIKYIDEKSKEQEYQFNIDIIDTIAPTIEFDKELSTTVGSNIDLLKNVRVTDNSNEDITATVMGEYDINSVGNYSMKYVASDSSGNKVEEEFTLYVKNIVLKTSGYYVATSGTNGYASVKFYGNNRFNWWADLSGYGEAYPVYDGTYKISGKTVTLNVEKEMTQYDRWVETDGSFTVELVDENKFIDRYPGGSYTFNWQSTSRFSSKHP